MPKRTYIAAAIAVLVLAGAAYLFFVQPSVQQMSTTYVYTTIVQKTGYLSSCQSINSPGSYFLSSDIKDTSIDGPCINVTSDNVAIVCDGKSIVGSGPFTSVGPFSYGIIASGVSNLSINGCMIGNFSYGVYTSNVDNFRLTNNNMSMNYINALFMSASTNGTLMDNLIENSSSPYGAVTITNGSSNNKLVNNTLKYNTYLGINVNSSSENFINNYVVGSQFSFSCTGRNGFLYSSNASSNICYNQTGCDFLTCVGINIPVNIGSIVLGKAVATCGSIRSPGTYSMQRSFDMKTYVGLNISQLEQYDIPCITIQSPDVTLDCGNNTISNAYIGFLVESPNVTLSNCAVSDSMMGASYKNSNRSTILSSTFLNDSTGISILNSSAVKLLNIIANNGGSGILLNGSTAVVVQNFTTNNNTFGIYLSNSLGNIFTNGNAHANIRFDIYGDSLSVNLSSDIMSSTSCNVTDTLWASCKQYIANASFKAFPITGCVAINRAGIYNLTTDLLGVGPSCIKIEASNVEFNCTGHKMVGLSGIPGPAIFVNRKNNVTIADCKIIIFGTGILAQNSTDVNVEDMLNVSPASYGVAFYNVSGGTIINNTVGYTRNASIYVYGSHGIRVLKNTLSFGYSHNYGLLVVDSPGMTIMNNSGQKNYIGIQLDGKSTNGGLVTNNTFVDNLHSDYSCDIYNSGIATQNGGANYGTVNDNCHWLAAVPIASVPIDCSEFGIPNIEKLAQDYVYGLGATCFDVRAGASTIDCQGHTILSTNGGTFARFINFNQKTVLENCNIKGFSTPIIVNNATLMLLNDSIYNNVTGVYTSSATAVNVTTPYSFYMEQTSIISTDSGLNIRNASGGTISDSNITGVTAYHISNVTHMQFTNDKSSSISGIGMYLNNSYYDTFSGGSYNGTSFGLFCSNSTRNTDQGGIYCSSQGGCTWISSSAATCR